MRYVRRTEADLKEFAGWAYRVAVWLWLAVVVFGGLRGMVYGSAPGWLPWVAGAGIGILVVQDGFARVNGDRRCYVRRFRRR